MNRYIPRKISDAVKKRHYFQCAWCCINLTDRHHIVEYSDWWEHSEENLILLCPNCHRQVHDWKIPHKELIIRKSSHIKNDRISANFNIDINELQFNIWWNLYQWIENILVYKNEKIVSANIINDNLLFNIRLYNIEGDLIFWMSQNRYWSLSKFNILCNNNSIYIYENSLIKDYIKITQNKKDNIIYIEGEWFIWWEKFIFNKHWMKFKNLTLKWMKISTTGKNVTALNFN